MDFRRVGHFHQQSQGQVLFHHEARPQAALRRRRLLATALRGYGPRAGSAGGERQQMIDEVRQGFHRLRSLFRRARQDRELDAEMSAHLELAIEENLERGLSPAEARRQALVPTRKCPLIWNSLSKRILSAVFLPRRLAAKPSCVSGDRSKSKKATAKRADSRSLKPCFKIFASPCGCCAAVPALPLWRFFA